MHLWELFTRETIIFHIKIWFRTQLFEFCDLTYANIFPIGKKNADSIIHVYTP